MYTSLQQHRLWALLVCLSYIYSNNLYAADSRAPLVVISEVRTTNVIKQVPLTGTITSPRVARLSSEVSGQVDKVHVEVGDHVKSGDVLVKLDSEIEELTFQASLATTQQARAELDDAKRRLANANRLKKQNSISINEIQLREAEVQIDDAALKKQLAEERRQQARVERHILKAPFDGVISERLTEVGEWIEPGKPILTLVDMDHLRVEFRVPQEFFISLDTQSQVNIKLDALPGKEFNGKIGAVVPISDPSARTFLIHVLLENTDVKMTPGMSVIGMLQLNTGKQGVVVSRDALLRYPDGRITVWVVNMDDGQATVSEKLVKLGHSFAGQVSIIDGLTAGEMVVVQGNESLQAGQAVRIHGQQ